MAEPYERDCLIVSDVCRPQTSVRSLEKANAQRQRQGGGCQGLGERDGGVMVQWEQHSGKRLGR